MNNPSNPNDDKETAQEPEAPQEPEVNDAPEQEPEAASAEADRDDQPVDETHHADHDTHAEHHHDEDARQGGGFAATVLKYLLIILAIFGLSLWLVPKTAPHLPTSIAKHIIPQQAVMDERFAAIEAQVGSAAETGVVTELVQQVADLTQRLETAEAALATAQDDVAAARSAAEASAGAATASGVAESVVTDAQAAAIEAAQAAEIATNAATEAGKVASAATRDVASLSRQMTSYEARMATLRSEVEAVGENLTAAAAEGSDASSAEITAAFAALKAKVDTLAAAQPDTSVFMPREEMNTFTTHDDLRSARTALGADLEAAISALPEGGALATTAALADVRSSIDTKLGEVGAQITDLSAKSDAAAAAAAEAKAAADQAVSTVDDAIQNASLKAAAAALSSQMANGAPFARSLDEIVALTGGQAPEALSSVAASGVKTLDTLTRAFTGLARDAIKADLRAGSDGSALGQATARVESLFAGRPKDAAEGDDAAAIVSRIEASLRDGDLPGALGEADGLSDAAKSVLGGWLQDARARVDADDAAAALVGGILGSQG
ncbi:MAG: mitofilin family membrane protein [Pseudomonadota bacterium]